MRKHLHLPLLAALPSMLAACAGDVEVDIDKYKRKAYNSYASCQRDYRREITHGLSNPCQKSSGSLGSSGGYFGPYTYQNGSTTRYVGYSPSGTVALGGLTYDSKKGTYGSFKAPVSRGGLTSSSRAGSSSSGSYGG